MVRPTTTTTTGSMSYPNTTVSDALPYTINTTSTLGGIGLTVKPNSAYFNCPEIEKWIEDNADKVEELIEAGKIKKQKADLETRKAANKFYRGLVKHVQFSGDTCLVYWWDDEYTKVRWDHDEEWDAEKAILACMAKRLYGGTNLFLEVVNKYAPIGDDHYWDVLAWEDEWEN